MRKSLSMLTTIIFILTISGILTLILQIVSLSSTKTLNNYFYNQSQLLIRSAAEYSLLALSGHSIKNENNCINSIHLTYQKIYDINVTVHYIGNGFPSSCKDYMLSNSLSNGSKESNGTVMLDIIVKVKNEPIKITKRLITKI